MDGIGEFPGTTELNWHDSTDRSGLDGISSSSAAAPAAPVQEAKRSGGGPRPTLDSQPQAAANTPSGNTGGTGGSSVVVDGATTRMTGIVRKKSGTEVLDGLPANGLESQLNNEFWILEFTPRQDVAAQSPGSGVHTKQTYGASLASSTSNQNRVSELAALERNTATVTVSNKWLWWQSDASLPKGTVRIGGDYQIAAS
ncbi:hypothetical protein [Corynebacterium flavescens]|uniref:hypothetical protein n=1 Tax=Corynebacterium flavescens TaxID=28028 RepID=UPI003FD29B37